MKLQTQNTRNTSSFPMGSEPSITCCYTNITNSNHCTSALGAVPVANITVFYWKIRALWKYWPAEGGKGKGKKIHADTQTKTNLPPRWIASWVWNRANNAGGCSAVVVVARLSPSVCSVVFCRRRLGALWQMKMESYPSRLFFTLNAQLTG